MFVNERIAAAYLGLQVKTLQRWRYSGEGPRYHKVGNAVRYTVKDLDAFVQPQGGEA